MKVDEKLYTGCEACISLCPTEAIIMREGIAKIIKQFCNGCGYCADGCGEEAIKVFVQEDFYFDSENSRMAA